MVEIIIIMEEYTMAIFLNGGRLIVSISCSVLSFRSLLQIVLIKLRYSISFPTFNDLNLGRPFMGSRRNSRPTKTSGRILNSLHIEYHSTSASPSPTHTFTTALLNCLPVAAFVTTTIIIIIVVALYCIFIV